MERRLRPSLVPVRPARAYCPGVLVGTLLGLVAGVGVGLAIVWIRRRRAGRGSPPAPPAAGPPAMN